MPPFHHIEYTDRDTYPGIPSCAYRAAIAAPTMFTPVVTPGWMSGFTGSANGGMKIRV